MEEILHDGLAAARRAILFQFDMAWSLWEIHRSGLSDEECLWSSPVHGLRVTFKGGKWTGDWPETEDYGIGAPNISWLTWHMISWWEMVFNHSFGAAGLDQFHDRWRHILETMPDDAFCDSTCVLWPFEDHPFYELAAWLNLELMKNVSEIGYCRFLYAAGQREHLS